MGKGVQWLSIPTVESSATVRASLVATGSVIAVNGIGSASASTLSSGQYSGLPILGIQNRIFTITTGNATAVSARIQVLVNNESQGR